MNKSKKLVFIPYAYDAEKETGINMIKFSDAFDIYCKNFCVALISLKLENPDDDVALVTNVDIPHKYTSILKQSNILIYKEAYDNFVFPDKYKWSLAFYKLCALKKMVEKYDYDYYCYVDTDIIANRPLDDVWKECEEHIMLYDINHGLNVKDYSNFLEESNHFLGKTTYTTHYGGEFFASNRKNAKIFIDECQHIYNEIIKRDFVTSCGDEFILSLAARDLNTLIKNAGAYIFRFWTGSFRLVSTSYKYNPVSILHLPSEKTDGIIKAFDKFVKKNKFPPKNKIYKMCHIRKIKLTVRIKSFIKRILTTIEGNRGI